MVRTKKRSCSSARPANAGSPTRATTSTMPAASQYGVARAATAILYRGDPSTALIRRARKKPARPDDEHGEEGDVAREDLPFRADARADRLREPEDNAAGERPPQTAET